MKIRSAIKKYLISGLLAALLIICAVTPSFAAGEKSTEQRLSDIQNDILSRKVGRYGMVPVYARDLNDGVYDISVDSSSAFFKIKQAQIEVKDGNITASITIGSKSYTYVYGGTKKEAGSADKSTWISGKVEDGSTTFTFPIKALDSEIECAAYSKARKKWYDRKILFDASSLPKDALKIKLPDYELIEDALINLLPEDLLEMNKGYVIEGAVAEPVSIDMDDGEYSVELDMAGGSGRASISSPTLLTIRDGKAYATLLWSSAYYDYVVLNGQKFLNQTTDGGNSTFEIPVTAFDEPVILIGDTTAMGDPVEIEYTLTFYAESIGDKGRIPQQAAKYVIIIALAIIVVGGVLNYFVKKKRKS